MILSILKLFETMIETFIYRYIPIVYFVDDIPFTDLEANLDDNDVVLGLFSHNDCSIYVLKGENQIKIMFHELGHWLIYLFTLITMASKKTDNRLHKLFDKYLTVIRKIGERESKQIATREAKRKQYNFQTLQKTEPTFI